MSIESVDIKGNLETVSNLSKLGMRCVDMSWDEFIPTLLEDLFEHIQRLVDDYAVARDAEDKS